MACRAKAVGDCALMKGIAPSRLPDSESVPSAIRVEPCLVRIQTANHAKNAKGKSLFACFEYFAVNNSGLNFAFEIGLPRRSASEGWNPHWLPWTYQKTLQGIDSS